MQQTAVDKCISLVAGLDDAQARSAPLKRLERDQAAYWALQQLVAEQVGLKIATPPHLRTGIDSRDRGNGSGQRSFEAIQEDGEPDVSDVDRIEQIRSEKEVLIATLFATALDDLREDPAFSGTSDQIQLLRASLSVGELEAKRL